MTDRIAELEARLEATQIELETQAHNFAVDKARDLREIARLKGELGKGAGVTDDTKLLSRLFDLWLSLRLGTGRKPAKTDDRIKALRWLVKHYEADGAEKAIRASARFRYLVYGVWKAQGKTDERKDDLTDFAGNAKRTEMLIALHDGEVTPEPQGAAEPRPRHPRGDNFDPVHELSLALERAGRRMTGNPYHHNKWVAQCPAHDDHDPSLSVTLKSGKVLLYCYAGCTTKAVIDALGLDWCDLFAPDFDHAKAVDACGPDPRPNGKPLDQLGLNWGTA